MKRRTGDTQVMFPSARLRVFAGIPGQARNSNILVCCGWTRATSTVTDVDFHCTVRLIVLREQMSYVLGGG